MAVEILIAAHDLNHSSKGYPKNAKDTPCVWGKKEGLPDYVILRITDATKNQVEYFLQQWHKKFAYDIVNENELGYRIRIKVDASFVAVSGLNKEIRSEMKTYINEVYGATVFSYDDYEAVLDIPKPLTMFLGMPLIERLTTLQELKDDIHDKFAEVIDHRFYYFDGADVDYALTQPGGIVERTKTQALVMIKSKLDD